MTDTITTRIELGDEKYVLTHNNYQGYSLKNEGTGEFKFKGQYLVPAENKLKDLVKEASCDHVTLWIDKGETFLTVPKAIFVDVFEQTGSSGGTFSALEWVVTGGDEI
jgi:hypothetical protein